MAKSSARRAENREFESHIAHKKDREMTVIKTRVSRVERFYKSFGIPGENIGVFLQGVDKEQIKEMLKKHLVVLIRRAG